LMPTQLMLDQYRALALVGFSLFGLGLAFYATPSTDAALSNLPAEQGGAGAGIYKMASSLGAAFGVAVSAAVFTGLAAGGGAGWAGALAGVGGRQDTVALREAAFVALACNLAMVRAAVAAVVLTIPAGKREAWRGGPARTGCGQGPRAHPGGARGVRGLVDPVAACRPLRRGWQPPGALCDAVFHRRDQFDLLSCASAANLRALGAGGAGRVPVLGEAAARDHPRRAAARGWGRPFGILRPGGGT